MLSDSICVLKAKPGKFDIKRRKPGILFISLPIVSLFTLTIMTYFFFIFCVDSASLATSFKKVQRHHDLIKIHVMR